MSFIFRKAVTSDTPALRELIALSARGLSRGFYAEDQIESAIKYVFGVDSQLVADGTYFVGEVGDTMVACGGWSKRDTLYGGDQFKGDHPDPLLNPLHSPARIRAFFIHPQWSRRGIGRELLALCERAAREEGFTAFELGSTLPGMPFYSALGFEALERSEIAFPDGVRLPIVRMRKDIPSH